MITKQPITTIWYALLPKIYTTVMFIDTGVKQMIQALQRYLTEALSHLHIMKAVEFEYDEYNPEVPVWVDREYSLDYFKMAMGRVTDEELRQMDEALYGVE